MCDKITVAKKSCFEQGFFVFRNQNVTQKFWLTTVFSKGRKLHDNEAHFIQSLPLFIGFSVNSKTSPRAPINVQIQKAGS